MRILGRTGRRNSGSALALALLVMVAVSAMGFSFLAVTSSVSSRQTGDIDAAKAFYIAEAGLAEAFAAVRIGRSGQIGSMETPAAYGGGLLWVDATETVDGDVRLESRGFSGGARSSLALIVEPIKMPLGFFADQDLILSSGLMVDGFDSTQATYTQELVALGAGTAPDLEAEFLNAMELYSYFARIYGEQFAGYIARPNGGFTFAELPEGFTFVPTGALEEWSVPMQPEDVDLLLDNLFQLQSLFAKGAEGPVAPSLETFMSAAYSGFAEDPESFEFVTPPTLPDNTGSGALIGSNGNVSIQLPAGELADIYGDIVPGPEGQVFGLGAGVSVSGDTEPRSQPVELPEVEVPMIPLLDSVVHSGELPLLVPAGFAGYLSLEVAADSEVILRGPATVVLGSLTLQPGSRLTLDTRDGELSLFVTGALAFEPGSSLVPTTEDPKRFTLQAAGLQGAGDPLVRLEGTGQLFGTVYSPQADVAVGGALEVFGGIVARRLEVAAGAKLHFDSAGYEGTPIPRLVSWRISQVPTLVGGALSNPFSALGIEREDALPLGESHDLAGVTLDLEYTDQFGTVRSYTGSERDFDWSLVTSVVSVARNARNPVEGPGGELGIESEGDASGPLGAATASDIGEMPPLPEPEPDAWHNQPSDFVSGVRKGITAGLMGAILMSDSQLFDALHACSPLNDVEMQLVIDNRMPQVSDSIIVKLEFYR